MFRVNPKTVTRWARAGKVRAIRTMGGHRRFYRSEVERVLEGSDTLPQTRQSNTR
jgi:excisionase family DNA binding protein